jgi:hypothetical protein
MMHTQNNAGTQLAEIQRIQMQDRSRAEALLRQWFQAHLAVPVTAVTLTPRPTSLNSLNGFCVIDGQQLFFKTHVEEQGVLDEYYNVDVLERAGYPVVKPVAAFRERGRQMLIYPCVTAPVVFDIVRALETNPNSVPDPARTSAPSGQGPGGADKSQNAWPDLTIEAFLRVERQEDRRLLDIYLRTLEFLPAQANGTAPVHQLFWHRLQGERMRTFYARRPITLPVGTFDIAALLRLKWVINGRAYSETLGAMFERAADLLVPSRPAWSVIGHGDAHNGNIFFEPSPDVAGYTYRYFDPAFAGRHSPLLDLAKPLFHNVFAAWMYFPQEVAQTLKLEARLINNTLYVEHDYVPSPVRLGILQARVELVLGPLVRELAARHALADDWQAFLKSALLCCPLLTINLADPERVPAPVALLGLAYTVEMGGLAYQGTPSLLDAALATISV